MLRRPLDDQAIEALLAGRPTDAEDLGPVASFIADVRHLARANVAVPSGDLASVLAGGFSIDKGDLLATAASNVPGPAPQVAGLPKRIRKTMIELLLAKLATAGLVAKAGLAAGALTLTATAAAATGNLPGPVQNGAADAIERVAGLDIPGGRSDGRRNDGEHRKDGSQVADENKTEGDEADTFGTDVSGRATSGEPKESGVDFGKSVSTDARAAHQPATAGKPATTPTADANPGTPFRSEAGTQAPIPTPTAESNPGTDHVPPATPTADSNPGTDFVPTPTPTADDNPGSSFRP